MERRFFRYSSFIHKTTQNFHLMVRTQKFCFQWEQIANSQGQPPLYFDKLSKPREHDIVPSLIPGGCSGLVQVLDVSVNKPFKGILRNVLDELMEAMNENGLDALNGVADSAVRRRRALMTHSVGEAWERVGSESFLLTS